MMRHLLLIVVLLLAACQTAKREHVPAPYSGESEYQVPYPNGGYWRGTLLPIADNQDQFIEFFRRSFFTDEAEVGKAASLIRFDRSRVTVSFLGNPPGEILEYFEDALEEVATVTGLQHRITDYDHRQNPGDIIVRFLSNDELLKATKRGGSGVRVSCSNQKYSYSRSDLRHHSSLIYVSSDKWTGMWKRCAYQELAHAFGLEGDGDLYVPSAFSDLPENPEQYTGWDRFALWLLYHPDLESGMDWEEAEPIVRRLVQQNS